MGDIKIYIPQQEININERIRFSNGTKVADDERYSNNSYVPDEPWRMLNDAEITELTDISGIEEPYKKIVTIFKFPEYLQNILRN